MMQKGDALIFRPEFMEDGDQLYVFLAAEDVDETEGIVRYHSVARSVANRVEMLLEPVNTTTIDTIAHHHSLQGDA